MRQIRARTWMILPYRDAILDAHEQGMSWAMISDMLTQETGVEWNRFQVGYFARNYAQEPTKVPQRELPALTHHDRANRVGSQPTTAVVEPTPPSTPPSPAPAPAVAEAKQPTPSIVPVDMNWGETSAPKPYVPRNFTYAEFNAYSLKPGTLVGDPITLPDGAIAQWGAYLRKSTRSVYECEINKDGYGVRFKKTSSFDNTQMWFYKSSPDKAFSEPTTRSRALKLQEKGVDPDTQLFQYPVITLRQYTDLVSKWQEWFVHQREGRR